MASSGVLRPNNWGYHDTLYSLEPRVSMSETEARVDWKWTDITGKQKKICTSAFERANVIFCYGAIQSQIAESSDLKDPNGLKQAVVALKTASGVFEFLASNCSMFGSSAGDLLMDVMVAYGTVMQAQAQECVFLRAEQANMPSTLVAKLASKTREYYDDGLKRCTVSSIKSHIPRDWLNNLSGKLQLFSALAQYHQSKVCDESRAIGERVARLMVAYDLMKTAARAGHRQHMVEQIKRERDSASKDNDLVYHEHVPNAKDLAPVPTEGALGKIELQLPLLKGEVPDLFTALLPLGVLEARKHATTIYRSLLAAETHRLREATNALNAVMCSLNLPAAIQLSSSEQNYDSILQGAARIRQQGGADRLREQVFSLPDSAERNRQILRQQANTLDDEEKTDENLRKQFGERWTRKPSKELNEQWRKDIQKMLNFLVETEKTDAMLANRFEEQAYFYELLSKTDLEIVGAIKDAQDGSGSSPTGNESSRQALAQVCSQIETLKGDRHSLCDQFEALQLPESILNQLFECYRTQGKVTEQFVLDALNVELQGSRECVRASERRQEELLSELQTKYESHFGHRSSTEAGGSLITRLNAAVDSFFALDKDVKEGMKFYAELTDRCLKVQEKIDDFCLARTTEKTEHLADITSSFGRVSMGETSPVTTTSAVPSRPPPTYTQAASAPQPSISTPTTAPTSVNPSSTQTGAMAASSAQPPVSFGQPGYGWGQQPYPYGASYPPYAVPGYPPVAGMPMYGFYSGYPPMPPTQMPPLPPYPMMSNPPCSFGQGQQPKP
ncbi:unnamed protein product [Dicrocoelium dendriticum]|nr:unnamed protein product [Dicrocoelium dendriticum]CAH8628334.1 unnamed protein product [Dicrocoelium dendriticum]